MWTEHASTLALPCDCDSKCSLELRELEGKLKAAYMNKERAAQLAERKRILEQQRVSVNINCDILALFCSMLGQVYAELSPIMALVVYSI